MHQNILRLFLYAPFAAVCGVIYWLSSMRHPPIPSFMRFHNGDKVLHMIAFFAVGFAAVLPLAYQRRHFGFKLLLSALILAGIYAGFDEIHQAFVPLRDSSYADFAADILGACLGILAFCIVAKLTRGTSKQSSEMPQ